MIIGCGWNDSSCSKTGFYECRTTGLTVELHNPLCDMVKFPSPNGGTMKPLDANTIERRWWIIGFNVATDICDWSRPIDDMEVATDMEMSYQDSSNIANDTTAAAPFTPGPKIKGVSAYFTKGK